jgi:hypothetical protein
MVISSTPPDPSNPSDTTHPSEVEATTSEIVEPTTNAATSVTTTNDTTIATELIPPLNDATNNMMIDNSQTEPSGIANEQDVDMLVGLDYGNIGETDSSVGTNDNDSVQPSVVLITNADYNRNLSKNIWKKDATIKANKWENK